MENQAACVKTQQTEIEKQFEVVDQNLAEFERQIRSHPFTALCQSNKVSIGTLQELARVQFSDATNWVPMLSFLKEQCKNPRLRRAIVDNIKCEAGCDGVPHTVLCKRFAESIGARVSYGLETSLSPLAVHPTIVMNGLGGMAEPEICGWLLATEALVPTFFRSIRPAFAKVNGSALRYLDEHITVDGDEHAVWLKEAAEDILRSSDSISQIVSGVQVGARTVISVLDSIYAVHCMNSGQGANAGGQDVATVT